MYVLNWDTIGEGFAAMIVVLALSIVNTWCSHAYNALLLRVPDPQHSFSFETNKVSYPAPCLQKGFPSVFWRIGDIDPTAEDPFDVEVWFEFVERFPWRYLPLEGA